MSTAADSDGLRSVAVGAAQCFAADAPLGAVWEGVVADGSPLFAVDGPGGTRGLTDLAVRRAVQDRVDPDTPVWALASPDLTVADEAAARARLAAEPGLAAVLCPTGAGLRRVERQLPAPSTAIVMAGGFGTRLRPLTDDTPKPLLDVGGRPLLLRILDQLHDAGVRTVHVSVHYLAERVEAEVGDGGELGLDVRYLHESEPLGTGAGLALLERADGPFLMINGDVLTNVDLRAMARHHVLQSNLATVATWLHAAPLPYGVVRHAADDRIEHIEEKPVYRYPVNAGIYVFAPRVLELVERGRPLAMVDFLNDVAQRERVGRFPLVEYWNDVGSHADYARAQREVHRL
ncbi:MAG: NTP transferase domain-containing protein [Planctomycetes bacterium]|nr:NTP transferase domain-containing protein [Planctomycetota bacterium]